MGDIYLHQLEPNDEWRFSSSHWVHTPVANDRHLFTLTGIVIIDYQGFTSNDWRKATLHLGIKFPRDFYPAGKVFKLEQWAPFVTINAIYNKDQAINAGWAVDDFGVEPAQDPKIGASVGIWANIAIRNSDGYMFRVGYTLTVSGVFVDAATGLIK